MKNKNSYENILTIVKERNKFTIKKPNNIYLYYFPIRSLIFDTYEEALIELNKIKNKQIFTSYKDNYLFIVNERNKFFINSGDRAFIEYYVGSDVYFNTLEDAYAALDRVKNSHNLERFDKKQQ